MKKKLLLAIALGAVASCAAAFVVGCSNPNSADNTPEHNYGEWVVDRKASCTRIGQKYHVCQDEGCNNLEWEAIPMIPHDYNIVENIAASGHALTCLGCRDTKIEAHEFDEETNICAVCGYEDGKLYELKYTLNDDNNSYAVSGFDYTVYSFDFVSQNVTEIIIPATYNGLAVTIIGKQAFKGCTNLKSVTISDGVTTIDDYAFNECVNLAKMYIPKNIKKIGNYSLNNFSYHASQIYHIHVYFNGSQTLWDSIEKGTSWGYHTTVVCYEVLSELGIKLKYKDDGTFEVAKFDATVTNLIIPSKYNDISITSIGNSAFSGCTSLEEITIPDSVTDIGNYAFDGCSALESIYYTGDMASWCVINRLGELDNRKIYIGDKKLTEMTNITIPDGVTRIGGYAFLNCNGLTNITIPDSVTSIGFAAFAGCSGLESVNLPDSVAHISNMAFTGCDGLESIYYAGDIASWCNIGGLWNLDKSKVYIGNQKLAEMTSITIPDGVTDIGSFTFDGCSGLTSIIIPNSVMFIGQRAFSGCSELTTIYCEAEEQPSGWGSDWNYSNCPVVWGYKSEDNKLNKGEN